MQCNWIITKDRLWLITIYYFCGMWRIQTYEPVDLILECQKTKEGIKCFALSLVQIWMTCKYQNYSCGKLKPNLQIAVPIAYLEESK